MGSSILTPLAVVDAEFEKYKDNSADKSFVKEFERDVQAALRKVVEERYEEIPFLTAERYARGAFRPYQLVRFRGLVQDVLDAEFFLAVYESQDKETGQLRTETSHYRDHIQRANTVDVDVDVDKSVISERFPFVMCPVPGENEWVKSMHAAQCAKEDLEVLEGGGRSGSMQRKRGGEDLVGEGHGQGGQGDGDSRSRRTVIRMDTNGADAAGSAMDVGSCTTCSSGNNSKSKLVAVDLPPTPYGTTLSDAPTSLVKLYGGVHTPALKLNDVVELVGVIGPYEGDEMEEDGRGQRGEGLEDGFDDGSVTLPSAKEMPRIHAVVAKKLGGAYPLFLQTEDGTGQDNNSSDSDYGGGRTGDKSAPWLVASPTSPVHADATQGPEHCLANTAALPDVQRVRSAVMRSIASALTKNCATLDTATVALASEYIMLAALSRVYDRQIDGSPLGVLSLNLMGCPAGSALIRDLDTIMQAFVPRTVSLDVTVDALNSGSFLAKKMFENNCMQPSSMQASAGTLFLLDETYLCEGTLDSVGVRSLDTVRMVANKQKLSVDFEFFDMKVLVDQPVLVASVVASIIGGAEVAQLNLAPATAPATAPSSSSPPRPPPTAVTTALECLDEETSEQARVWWAACRYLRTKISPEVGCHLEDTFVSMRQADPSVSATELQVWLRLGHLVAISHGTGDMTADHLNRAIHMENLRKKNLRVNQVTNAMA